MVVPGSDLFVQTSNSEEDANLDSDADQEPFDDSDVSEGQRIEDEANGVYRVREVLAERNFIEDGEPVTKYLTSWRGYEWFHHTWEPFEHFTAAKTMIDWKKRKDREARGLSTPFDVDAWEQKLEAYCAAVEEKKKRKQRQDSAPEQAATKRRRLVNKASLKRPRISDHDSDTDASTDDASSEDEPLSKRQRAKHSTRPAESHKPKTKAPQSSFQAEMEDVHIGPSQTSLFGASSPQKPANSNKPAPAPSRPSADQRPRYTVAKPAPGPAIKTQPKPTKVKVPLPINRTLGPSNTGSGIFSSLSKQNRFNKGYEAAPQPGAVETFNPSALSTSVRKTSLTPIPTKPLARAPNTATPASGPSGATPSESTAARNAKASHNPSAPSRQPPVATSFFEDLLEMEPRNANGAPQSKPPSTLPSKPPSKLPSKPAAPRQGGPVSSAPEEFLPTPSAYSNRFKKQFVACRRWLIGDCKYGDDCSYAHSECKLIADKKSATCNWWRRGKCRHNDDTCDRWHLEFDYATRKITSTVPDPELAEPLRTAIAAPVRPIIQTGPADTRRPHGDVATVPELDIGDILTTVDIVDGINADNSLTIPSMCLQFLTGYKSVIQHDIFCKSPLKVTHWSSSFEVMQLLAFPDRPIAAGRIFVRRPSIDFSTSMAKCQALGEALRVSRAVVLDHDYCLLLMRDDESWWFLPHTDAPCPPNAEAAGLCFEVYNLRHGINDPSQLAKPYPATATPVDCACERLFADVDCHRIFGELKPGLQRLAFLMYPTHLTAEIELITAWLASRGVLVYHSGIPGAWKAFSEDLRRLHPHTSAILYHPSMDHFSQFFDFREHLLNGFCSHFELYLGDQATSVYQLTRLFPSGQAILIMDHVLQYYPADALACIESFAEECQGRDRTTREDLLVFRPGVEDFLMNLNDAADAVDDQVKVTLYQSILAKMYELQGDEPLEASDELRGPSTRIVSLPADEGIAPEYVDAWAEDEEKAASIQVEWFAAWTVENRQRLRRFVVIHRNAPAGQAQGQGQGHAGTNTSTVHGDILAQEASAVASPSSVATGQSDETRREWTSKYAHMQVLPPEKYLTRRYKRVH